MYVYITCLFLVIVLLILLIRNKIKTNLYQGIYVDGLIVKKSNLIEAGNGLFTTIDIPKNTIIGYYKGKIYNNEDEYIHSKTDGIYMWENDYYNRKNNEEDDKNNTSSFYIDARDIDSSNILRYVNDFRTDEGNNLDIVRTSGHMYYKTKKDIRAGSELYINYGDYYWN